MAVFLWHADSLATGPLAVWGLALAICMWALGAVLQGRIHMGEMLLLESAVLATAIRIGVKSDGSVSYMNPDYWGRAYLREGFGGAEPALRSVRARLAHALGEGAAFGGDVPEADLPSYRYMIGMERIDSLRNELASFASFDEALKTVRANLAKGVGGTSAVYEVVLPEAKLAVIGVAMNDPETGEGWWAGKIGVLKRPSADLYRSFGSVKSGSFFCRSFFLYFCLSNF